MKQKTIENDPCEAEFEECEANHEAEFLLFSGLEMRVRTLNYYYHVIVKHTPKKSRTCT